MSLKLPLPAPSPTPVLLNVPGLLNSGPRHWQTAWEHERADCRRVELGCWDEPIRNVWISRVDQAVHDARGEVILIAHSLGCLAVAWWAHLLGASGVSSVRGALLVAPPDVDRPGADPRLQRFAPTPPCRLPFPSLLVASHDDHYAGFDRARAMAQLWGSVLVDIGECGHINADSALGGWREGQDLLVALLEGSDPERRRVPLADRVAIAAPRLRVERTESPSPE